MHYKGWYLHVHVDCKIKMYRWHVVKREFFTLERKSVYSKKVEMCIHGICVCVRITDSRARLWKQSFLPSSLHSRWFSGEPARCSCKTAGGDLQCTLGYHSAQGRPRHTVPAHLLLCFTSQAWTPPTQTPQTSHTPNPTDLVQNVYWSTYGVWNKLQGKFRAFGEIKCFSIMF